MTPLEWWGELLENHKLRKEDIHTGTAVSDYDITSPESLNAFLDECTYALSVCVGFQVRKPMQEIVGEPGRYTCRIRWLFPLSELLRYHKRCGDLQRRIDQIRTLCR